MEGLRFGRDRLEGLALPDLTSWGIFPFEGDMSVRTVEPFEAQDFPRDGEPGGKPCYCESDEVWPSIWANDEWNVRPLEFRPGIAPPIPAYMLNSAMHTDIAEFDDARAADFGIMTARLVRAIRSIGDIGRVHFNRWGDGGSHFHVWFLARPLGAWQLSGFSLPLWGHALPPLDDEVLESNHRAVASYLQQFD